MINETKRLRSSFEINKRSRIERRDIATSQQLLDHLLGSGTAHSLAGTEPAFQSFGAESFAVETAVVPANLSAFQFAGSKEQLLRHIR